MRENKEIEFRRIEICISPYQCLQWHPISPIISGDNGEGDLKSVVGVPTSPYGHKQRFKIAYAHVDWKGHQPRGSADSFLSSKT